MYQIDFEKYDRKKYAAKKKKLHNNLGVGEKVLVLAERNYVYNKKKAKYRQKDLLLAKKRTKKSIFTKKISKKRIICNH